MNIKKIISGVMALAICCGGVTISQGSELSNLIDSVIHAEAETINGMSSEEYQELTEEVLALLNQYRISQGVEPLKSSPLMMEMAQIRAAEQEETGMSHYRPDGSLCFSIIDEYGLTCSYYAENAASGSSSAEYIMEMWKNSSGHNANMLNSALTHVGIGVTYYNGTYYWIQFFVSTTDSKVTSDEYLTLETSTTTTTTEPTTTEPTTITTVTEPTTTEPTTTTTVASDTDNIYNGSCGENCTYSFDITTGTLTISGTGDMENYSSSSDVPWYSFKEDIKTIIIEDGVTSIGNDAFYGCISLTEVTMPNSITSIGEYAFFWCKSLTEITIPNSVTSIDAGAFSGCTSLTSVIIPDSVTSINSFAFHQCTSLTEVTIPDSVTDIGIYTFGYYYDDSYNELKIENFTIYGVSGSTAETYATENDFIFIESTAITTEPTTTTIEPIDTVTTTEPTNTEPTTITTTTTDSEDPYANCIFDVNQDGDVKSNDLLLLKKRLLGLI
ncbi:MAG: leucine-rich repeat protein [Ruminococcus sp.]|nr:leucine-rich repeat protein [Ruminococcus sp.]